MLEGLSMNFKSYPIYKSYYKIGKLPKGFDTPEFSVFLNRVSNDRIYAQIALFDGIEKAYNRVSKVAYSYSRPLYISPPVGPITLKDILAIRYDNYFKDFRDLYVRRSRNERLGTLVGDIANSMFHGSVWDEKVLYRFMCLNEFLAYGGSQTFGEYVSENEKKLYRIFNNFSGGYYDHTYYLYSVYSGTKPLYYRNKALSKVNPVINSLTVDECITIMEDYSDTNVRVTDNNYSRVFLDIVKEIRTTEDIPSEQELSDRFFKAFLKSVDTFGCGNLSFSSLSHDFSSIVKLFARRGNMLKKLRIVKGFEKIAEEITPVEMLTMVYVMEKPGFAFRSTTSELAIEIFDNAFEKLDNVQDFIVFLTQLVFDYDDVLASYGEWMKSINSGGEDYSMGPIIALGMMTSDRKLTLYRNIPYAQYGFRKKYANWAD